MNLLGLAFWAKALITGAILTLVFTRVDVSTVADVLSKIDLPSFLAAVGILVPLEFTGVQRWRNVAARFGVSLTLQKGFMYSCIGQFINLGLPTVVGLDSVRAWKLHKQGLPVGLATRIVVVDRLCSLFTLLLIIALGLPHLLRYDGSEIFKHSVILALVFGSAALMALSAAKLVGRIFPARRARHLYQISKDFNQALFGKCVATIWIVFWSICNHLCRIATVLFLALALGIGISPIDAFTLVPSALLIAMVPISLAGWGVREVIFIQAFSLAGVVPNHALALSILYGLVGLLTGLVGGAVWFVERRQQRPSIAP